MRTMTIIAAWTMLFAGACTSTNELALDEQSQPATVTVPCRIVVLTGVGNLVIDVRGMAERIVERYPDCTLDVRTWGAPLRSLHNLTAEERNRETAREKAAELTAFARTHPDARITVIGYSGGGGMAVFVVEALPEEVMIDRLILIAPAISPDYPIEENAIPHVREFMVNYASERDLQVGLGTRMFGTMDREPAYSAGYCGFNCDDSKLVQIHWTEDMMRTGHFGNHLGYLAPAWQKKYLMPAIDPSIDATKIQESVTTQVN